MWTLDEAIEFLRCINPWIQQFNYHCGIIGSIPIKGFSNNDLDICILPYENKKEVQEYGLTKYLDSIGAIPCAHYENRYRKVYKLIKENNKTVDFFVY